MAKRRTFTPEFKAKVVLEVISGSQSAAEACRRYSLKPQVLSRWKAEFIDNAAKVCTAPIKLDTKMAFLSEHLPG